MTEVAYYRWVLRAYQPHTEEGKKVLAAAKAKSNYILVNKSRGKTDPVIVAFKYVGQDMPHYLTPASKEQVEKLEKMR